MPFLVFSVLPTLAAIGLAVCVSLIWWASLRTPWLFLTVSTLAMLGLDRLLATVFDYAPIAFGSRIFLEHQPRPSFERIVSTEHSFESFAISGAVLILGIPLLFLLRKALGSNRDAP